MPRIKGWRIHPLFKLAGKKKASIELNTGEVETVVGYYVNENYYTEKGSEYALKHFGRTQKGHTELVIYERGEWARKKTGTYYRKPVYYVEVLFVPDVGGDFARPSVQSLLKKSFDTKEQAFKFAIEWMRKHPNG